MAGRGAWRSEAAILCMVGCSEDDDDGSVPARSRPDEHGRNSGGGGVSCELELQLRMGRSWLSCLLRHGSRKLPARTAPTRPRRGGGVGARPTAPSSSSPLVLLFRNFLVNPIGEGAGNDGLGTVKARGRELGSR